MDVKIPGNIASTPAGNASAPASVPHHEEHAEPPRPADTVVISAGKQPPAPSAGDGRAAPDRRPTPEDGTHTQRAAVPTCIAAGSLSPSLGSDVRPSKHAQRVRADDTLESCRAREGIVWEPTVDGEPVLTPRGTPMSIRWKPGEQSIKVRRHVQDFVDAFARGDYASARAAAMRCGESEDVRHQNVPIEVDPARLDRMQTDPIEMRLFMQEMDRIGEAQHGIENQGRVDQRHQFPVRLPQLKINFGPGKAFDLITGEASPNLSDVEKSVADSIARSDIGKRLQAEHALTLLEERLHVEQFRHHGILSPTFARFATDKATPRRGSMLFEALLELPDKPRTLMEAEIPALLYDAGMPLDTIRDHFLSRHPQERERIMAYLYERAGQT